MKFVSALLILFFCMPQVFAKQTDIGVICTLPQEIDSIINYSNGYKKIRIANRDFYEGEVNQRKLIFVRSPMGKVNNAITAQILIDNFNVSSIFSVGFSGALQNDIQVGDIVIATDAIQHDTGTIKPYGFVWSEIAQIKRTKKKSNNWLNKEKYNYGKLVSGDQFISDAKKRDWLAKKFDALAVDTNSAAIKHVCNQNKVDCIFIREISDYANIGARQSFGDSVKESKLKTVNVLKDLLYSEVR